MVIIPDDTTTDLEKVDDKVKESASCVFGTQIEDVRDVACGTRTRWKKNGTTRA